MRVHLIDGTYELFRHYYAVPSHITSYGLEVAAVRGVLSSLLRMLQDGVTHIGVATDHVIESFRNDLWPGYKRGDGIDPALFQQFPLLEEALDAMGVAVWPMIELEADDALASAAFLSAKEPAVEQVLICTPDKDLAQCVQGDHVVQFDRRKRAVFDEGAIVARFGVPPVSIPDYLALVGDSADGFPGLPGWGARSAAAVLARYGHLQSIPPLHLEWDVPLRGIERLSEALEKNRELAYLFRDLATLRTNAPLFSSVAELRWSGPRPAFEAIARALEAPQLWDQAQRLTSV